MKKAPPVDCIGRTSAVVRTAAVIGWRNSAWNNYSYPLWRNMKTILCHAPWRIAVRSNLIGWHLPPLLPPVLRTHLEVVGPSELTLHCLSTRGLGSSFARLVLIGCFAFWPSAIRRTH